MSTSLVAITAENIISRALDGHFYSLRTDPQTFITKVTDSMVPREHIPEHEDPSEIYGMAADEAAKIAASRRAILLPEVKRLRSAGFNARMIGEQIGLSESGVRRIVKEAGLS